MTSSLPGPASTLAPVRLSVTLTVPPARRIRGDQVPAVLDGAGPRADLVPFRSGLLVLRGDDLIGAVAEGGHAAGRERERHLGQRPVLASPDALGQGRHRVPGVVAELDPAAAVLRHRPR